MGTNVTTIVSAFLTSTRPVRQQRGMRPTPST